MKISLFPLLFLGCMANSFAEDLPRESRSATNETGFWENRDKPRVTVHSAYNYTGYSYYEATAAAKKIAVDVSFSVQKKMYDLDDVDVIDAESGENFGSDPHIEYLSAEGELIEVPKASDVTIRVLLIYAVPKRTTKVRLSYWGEFISEAIDLKARGPISVPTPKKVK